MTRTIRAKALWLVSVASMAFTILAIPKIAWARPCEFKNYWYYSDADYTNEVGGEIRDCDGKDFTWGETTGIFIYLNCCCENSSCSSNPDYSCNDGAGCYGGNACPVITFIC